MFEKKILMSVHKINVSLYVKYNIGEKISIFKHLVDNNMYTEKDIPVRGYGVVH